MKIRQYPAQSPNNSKGTNKKNIEEKENVHDDDRIIANDSQKNRNLNPNAAKGNLNSLLRINQSETHICMHCLTQQVLINLSCQHKFCKNCIEYEFLKQKLLISEGKIRCWVCFSYLDYNLVYFALGGTKNVQILKSKLSKNLAIPSFHCEICYAYLPIEQFITLDCNHRFCKLCLVQYISQLIIEKKINRLEFTCPACNEYISPYIIQAHCPSELFEKYNNSFFDVYLPEDSKNIVKKCHYCGYLLEFDSQITKIKCSKCKNKYCIYCNKNHWSDTCEMKKLEDLKKVDFRIKKCPKCQEIIEKEQGCNYVQCPWPACHRFSFCYLCLKPLSEEEHYSHFPDGAYVDNCKTLEKLSHN